MSNQSIMVKANLPWVQRSLLSKLQCGILPLEIETGCYSRVRPDERFCKVCGLNRVEDEYHFLFSCPLLQLERSSFYLEAISDIEGFMLKSDAEKTKFLLSEDMIKMMGNYVETIFKKRRSILYKPTK